MTKMTKVTKAMTRTIARGVERSADGRMGTDSGSHGIGPLRTCERSTREFVVTQTPDTLSCNLFPYLPLRHWLISVIVTRSTMTTSINHCHRCFTLHFYTLPQTHSFCGRCRSD